MFYAEMSRPELAALKESLEREYAGIKAGDLDLDLSRGKPGSTQRKHSAGWWQNIRIRCFICAP